MEGDIGHEELLYGSINDIINNIKFQLGLKTKLLLDLSSITRQQLPLSLLISRHSLNQKGRNTWRSQDNNRRFIPS